MHARRATMDRKNAPTLVLVPNSPTNEQEGPLSLVHIVSHEMETPKKYPFSLSVKQSPQVDGALRSPSLTPRAGSVWAAQNLSRTLSTDTAHSPGHRTPSGFEHLDFGADYFTNFSAQKRVPRSFEWEYWAVPDEFDVSTPSLIASPPGTPTSKSSGSPSLPMSREVSEDGVRHPEVLKRRLGPNETSYYLGSRGAGQDDPLSGVNDMYLHIGFKAPKSLVTPERVSKIWTELRLRHTLLGSSIEYQDFEDVRFVFKPLLSFEEAHEAALEAFQFKYNTTKAETLDLYLNGNRYLSDRKLAALWITTEAPEASSDLSNLSLEDEEGEFHFWLLATHFLGDGMALHTTANEFFELLGGKFEEFEELNNGLEWNAKTGQVILPPLSRLPPAMETRIATPESYGRLAWAGARVEFNNDQARTIGGQTFPRARLGTRHTVVPTFAFSKEETSAILKSCKANGVTIAHAIFALTNLAKITLAERSKAGDAWAAHKDKTLPMMLYSALNLRPNMIKGPEEESHGIKSDFFHLVIGYYNVTLPAFIPAELSMAQTFWLRARQTKQQTVKAVKSPFLTQRSKLMCLERERRAIRFEKEDEARRRAKAALEAGLPIGLGLGKPPAALSPKAAETPTQTQEKPKAPVAPSAAFLGVSMLGNLDGMYKHATFSRLKLFDLTTGSRQRPGASLLFAYTFSGRLFYSLGYDQNAYPVGSVEAFWQEMLDLTRQLMI